MGQSGSWPAAHSAQAPQGTWWATATRVPAGSAPATTSPVSSWPSTVPSAARAAAQLLGVGAAQPAEPHAHQDAAGRRLGRRELAQRDPPPAVAATASIARF